MVITGVDVIGGGLETIVFMNIDYHLSARILSLQAMPLIMMKRMRILIHQRNVNRIKTGIGETDSSCFGEELLVHPTGIMISLITGIRRNWRMGRILTSFER